MADVKMTDFANETAATLDGNEYVIMADAAEGKKITVTNLQTYLSQTLEPYRKEVTLNATAESTDKTGYNYLQTVSITGMTANHWVEGYISSGTYNNGFAVESVTGAINLWFVTKPGTSVKIMLVYAPTRT